MNYTEYGDSLLIVQFRAFYSEVIRIKKWLVRSSRIPQQQIVADDSTIGRSSDQGYDISLINEIWHRLEIILEKQRHLATQLGGEYWSAYEEAQYVMVALADEILLHTDWEGRYSWNFNLLESRLFQTHVAGERFFQNIDRLLEMRTSLRVELAKIYLMSLSLGFQGKFRGTTSQAELRNYRTRLHTFIMLGSDGIIDEMRPLFPQTYEHTPRGGEVRRLPSARKWIIVLSGTLLVMLGISHLLWQFIVANLYPILDKIHP